MAMHRKCPYLSTHMECFAGSFGTARCFDHSFHSSCGFRLAADNKGNPSKASAAAELVKERPELHDDSIEKNIAHFFARFMK